MSSALAKVGHLEGEVRRFKRLLAEACHAKEHRVSLAEAARHFGISRERVRQKWREIFGDEPTPAQEAQDQRAVVIAALARQGRSPSEIARAVNLTTSAVYARRDHDGLVMADGFERVPKKTRAKILTMARKGKSRAEIVHVTGVSYTAVSKYLAGHPTRGAYTVAPAPWPPLPWIAPAAR